MVGCRRLFVRASDVGQLFAALGLALERRRPRSLKPASSKSTVDGIAWASPFLELTDILTGALQRLMRAMDAAGAAVGLRGWVDESIKECTRSATWQLHLAWDAHLPGCPDASDERLEPRAVVDFAELVGGNPHSPALRAACRCSPRRSLGPCDRLECGRVALPSASAAARASCTDVITVQERAAARHHWPGQARMRTSTRSAIRSRSSTTASLRGNRRSPSVFKLIAGIQH